MIFILPNVVCSYLNIGDINLLSVTNIEFQKYLNKHIIANKLHEYLCLLKLMRRRPVYPRLYGHICGLTFFEKEKRYNKIVNTYFIQKRIITMLSFTDNVSYRLVDSLIINYDIKDPIKFCKNRQLFLDTKSFV